MGYADHEQMDIWLKLARIGFWIFAPIALILLSYAEFYNIRETLKFKDKIANAGVGDAVTNEQTNINTRVRQEYERLMEIERNRK